MTGRLAGSAVVVTGGAAGLGLAYARRFLREGACVFIADIVDPAGAVASLDAGDRVGGCRVDVASAASVAAMVETAHRRLGRIDVLINNAAVFASLKPQPFDAIPEEEWDRVMAVNVRGMWNCVKAVVPVMRAQKARAHRQRGLRHRGQGHPVPAPLRGLQGRGDRDDARAGPGAGRRRHRGERGGARPDPERHRAGQSRR